MFMTSISFHSLLLWASLKDAQLFVVGAFAIIVDYTHLYH